MFWRSSRVQKPYLILIFFLLGIIHAASATSSLPRDTSRNGDSQSSHLHIFRASSLSTERPENASLYSDSQRIAIQIVAAVMGGLSLLGSTLTLYWFIRMKRLFRHQLIMMLIVANIVRSTWYFVFPLTVFTNNIETRSNFCQASGFITQLGVEMADISVLFIAIHTAMQVFRPKPPELGQSGLAPHRHIVFFLFIILPIISASIPFARGAHMAYVYQGPTCSLPVRPFWYRLGLSWIPRYAIMLTIICLYIAIYLHAGFVMSIQANQFNLTKLRSNNSWRQRRKRKPPVLNLNRLSRKNNEEKVNYPQTPDPERGRPEEHEHHWSSACSPLSSPVRGSRAQNDHSTISESEATPRKSSDLFTGSTASTLLSGKPHHDSISQATIPKTALSVNEDAAVKNDTSQVQAAPNNDGRHFLPFQSEPILDTNDMRRRRNSIRRHLRLLFIYPMVYFAVWTIPFVMNVLNYDNYYAQHPIFVITLLSYLAVSSMGLIDSIVFALREKPWRHIARSDGTFIGSFICWGQRDCCNRNTSYSQDTPDLSARRSSATAQNAQSLSTLQASSAPQPSTQAITGRKADVHRLNGIGNWDFAVASASQSTANNSNKPVRPWSIGAPPESSDHQTDSMQSARPYPTRTNTLPVSRNWFDDL